MKLFEIKAWSWFAKELKLKEEYNFEQSANNEMELREFLRNNSPKLEIQSINEKIRI